ncbi:MAG: hypothetical protein P8Z79_14570 [Sedimentisphaerales bacterium]|jgi:hypothetical protein
MAEKFGAPLSLGQIEGEPQTVNQVVVENPVINSPFGEPRRHLCFADEGMTNEVIDGGRPIG